MSSDREEMVAFCERTFPRLVGALALHCGDVHLAEDLAQEALLKACRRWSHVRSLDSPAGWAFRVGVNLSTSWFRSRRVRERAHDALRAESAVEHRDPDVGITVAVREALATLTDKQRQALVLRYYLGHTAVEAAELMGATPGGVRALTHRALEALRETFDVAVPEGEEVSDVS